MVTTEIPSEIRLLACLSRHPFTADDAADAAAICAEGVETSKMVRLCRFHRLGGHISATLTGDINVDIPKQLKLRLIREGLVARKQTDAQLAEMHSVMSTLQDANIEVFPIKGPAVAKRYYNDAARRVLYDIDLLVRPEDTFRAVQLIEARGLKHVKSSLRSGLKEADVERLHRWGSNIGLRSDADKSVLIELHWRPGRHRFEFPVELDDIWAQRVPMEIDGRDTWSMAPMQEALFLMSHGAKHEWKRLHWLCDIAAMLRDTQFDWRAFCEFAAACRLERVAASALELASIVFDLPVSEDVQDLIDRQQLFHRVDAIIERRYRQAATNDSSLEEALMEWRNADLFPGASARVQAIVSHLQPGPDDWAWVRLPDWANLGYYPVRIARIVIETGRAAFTAR